MSVRKFKMRSIFVCLLIVVLQPRFGLLAKAVVPEQTEPGYQLWLVRSQAITDDLIKDAADLDQSNRALLWARLAQQWWQTNPEKARVWMAKAIETVEAVPNKEAPDKRQERLTVARLLFQIAAPLDQKLTKRLLVVLSDDHPADAERAANADSLIDAAATLVNTDPKRAAELGALALRTGYSNFLPTFLYALRHKDPTLADGLFSQALVVGRQTLSGPLIDLLTRTAFPVQMQLPDRPVPPDNLRAELLQLHVVFLQANQIKPDSQNDTCTGVITFIAPVVLEFDRLLPQQAPIVRQAVNQCKSANPLGQQRIDDALRNQPLNTIEDLLKAADDAEDLKVRTVYQFRAATLATQKKDYERAIKILDGMSKDARTFMGGTWEARRWEWATLSAIKQYEAGAVFEMRQTINAVPAELQPFSKISFLREFKPKPKDDADPTLQFLTEARADLRRTSYGSDTEKYSWYFVLLELTVKYQPEEARMVLKEAIAVLNRAEEAKAADASKDQPVHLDTSAISSSLPATLLEMDEYAVKEAVSSIASTRTRAEVRLELLGACLQRMRTMKQPAAASKAG